MRRALLSTALDITIEGADAVKRHADPVAGGLFEYVTFEGGFELRSNAQGLEQAIRNLCGNFMKFSPFIGV